MKEKFIKSYVKQLTKQDIIKYAEKNNIKLSNNELDLIYNVTKTEIDTILSNPEHVLNKIKYQLSPQTYNKLYELYTIYYPKLYH